MDMRVTSFAAVVDIPDLPIIFHPDCECITANIICLKGNISEHIAHRQRQKKISSKINYHVTLYLLLRPPCPIPAPPPNISTSVPLPSSSQPDPNLDFPDHPHPPGTLPVAATAPEGMSLRICEDVSLRAKVGLLSAGECVG
jgi:hypothetical protein